MSIISFHYKYFEENNIFPFFIWVKIIFGAAWVTPDVKLFYVLSMLNFHNSDRVRGSFIYIYTLNYNSLSGITFFSIFVISNVTLKIWAQNKQKLSHEGRIHLCEAHVGQAQCGYCHSTSVVKPPIEVRFDFILMIRTVHIIWFVKYIIHIKNEINRTCMSL